MKKLLVALLAFSSVAFAGPCPSNVRGILQANHGTSLKLSYSPDQADAANACEKKVKEMVQKKTGKELTVEKVELPADPKGQFKAS